MMYRMLSLACLISAALPSLFGDSVVKPDARPASELALTGALSRLAARADVAGKASDNHLAGPFFNWQAFRAAGSNLRMDAPRNLATVRIGADGTRAKCSVPLTNLVRSPEKGVPLNRMPLPNRLERMPNYVPAPPCDE